MPASWIGYFGNLIGTARLREHHHWSGRRVFRTKEKKAPRPIHHSPVFWVGAAMFLLAILTYVFSDDLSLRLRPQSGPGHNCGAPLTPR
jgi:hypothetical protein